jgi:hypothetical protein
MDAKQDTEVQEKTAKALYINVAGNYDHEHKQRLVFVVNSSDQFIYSSGEIVNYTMSQADGSDALQSYVNSISQHEPNDGQKSSSWAVASEEFDDGEFDSFKMDTEAITNNNLISTHVVSDLESAPIDRCLQTYHDFVNGTRPETLSSVINSTVSKRPQIIAYVRENTLTPAVIGGPRNSTSPTRDENYCRAIIGGPHDSAAQQNENCCPAVIGGPRNSPSPSHPRPTGIQGDMPCGNDEYKTQPSPPEHNESQTIDALAELAYSNDITIPAVATRTAEIQRGHPSGEEARSNTNTIPDDATRTAEIQRGHPSGEQARSNTITIPDDATRTAEIQQGHPSGKEARSNAITILDDAIRTAEIQRHHTSEDKNTKIQKKFIGGSRDLPSPPRDVNCCQTIINEQTGIQRVTPCRSDESRTQRSPHDHNESQTIDPLGENSSFYFLNKHYHQGNQNVNVQSCYPEMEQNVIACFPIGGNVSKQNVSSNQSVNVQSCYPEMEQNVITCIPIIGDNVSKQNSQSTQNVNVPNFNSKMEQNVITCIPIGDNVSKQTSQSTQNVNVPNFNPEMEQNVITCSPIGDNISKLNYQSNQIVNIHSNTFYRQSLTEDQKKFRRDLNLKTAYVTGEGDQMFKLFKNKPKQLNKEIIEKAVGQVDRIQLTKKGALRIVAKDNAQRNRLLKISSLDNKPAHTSIPFETYAERSVTSKLVKTPPQYFVKGVIHGLVSSQSKLNEIAKEVGACKMSPLGKSENNKSTLITYSADRPLPPVVEIDNKQYKVNLFIPKPMRCDQCQRYGHLKSTCVREVVCSRCSGRHSYLNCNNLNTYKCSNCNQKHSAAFKGCGYYLEVQAALKIRAEEGVPYAVALRRVQGRKNQDSLNRETSSNIPPIPINKHLGNNFTWRPAPSRASNITAGTVNKTIWPNLPNTIENPLPLDIDVLPPVGNASVQLDTTAGELSSQQLVKSFFNYNKSKYQAVNLDKNKPVQNVRDETTVTDDKARFVLGVLALIDKCETKYDAKFVLCQVASTFMYKNEVVFKCPGI